MKIGLVARADKTGLAVQTYQFWRNMNPEKTLVVDLSYCSGKKPDMSLYPGAKVWRSKTYPNNYSEPDDVIDEFLEGLDMVFTCETPYNYWLFERAREKGIKTVLQFNYEFLEYLVAPNLPLPDMFAAPSSWHWKDVHRSVARNSQIIDLPVPVDLELLKRSGAFGKRTKLRKVLHTVGNPAMEDRNGTDFIYDMLRYLKSPIEIEIRAQRRIGSKSKTRDGRINANYSPTKNHWDLYTPEIDMYVMPRRFGGLCLPMNESLGLGIPTLMSDCPPNSDVLPQHLLVESHRSHRIQTRARIWVNNINPAALAKRLDQFYNRPELVEEYSEWALNWSSENSWEAMRSVYESTFESLG